MWRGWKGIVATLVVATVAYVAWIPAVAETRTRISPWPPRWCSAGAGLVSFDLPYAVSVGTVVAMAGVWLWEKAQARRS